MHMGKDRRDRANVARGFGSPGISSKVLDKTLVDVIVGGENLRSTLAESTVNLGLARCHGSSPRDLSYLAPSHFDLFKFEL